MWALFRFLGRLVVSGGVTGFLVGADSKFVLIEFLGAWGVLYALLSYFLHFCRVIDEEDEKDAQERGYRTVISGGGCMGFLLAKFGFPLFGVIFLFYLFPMLLTFLTPDAWDEPISKVIQGVLILGIICFDVYSIIKEFKKPNSSLNSDGSSMENDNNTTKESILQVRQNDYDEY